MYEVEAMTNIDYGATGVQEVLQNVAFVLSSYEMTCPLDREFGIKSVIDKPITIVKALHSASVVEAINKFEPRATVETVEISGEAEQGLVRTKVKVTINDESI